MNLLRIKHIFIKEVSIEFRQKFALAGIFLFAATMVFLIYKSFNDISTREWTVLLWIVTLFAGLNAIVKSFLQEKRETYLYYYTLFDPIELIIAKLVYNFIFLALLFLSILLFMSVFVGFPVRDLGLFFGGSALGLFGISVVFTFVSVISSSENGNATLMAILALPLSLPVLLLLLKITAVSTGLINDTEIDQDVVLLCGVDAILLGCVFLLFPILWRS
ncbi:MAG: heme exporter protein CcmB [Saprospiraceae bacterium]|nr:heme exporter protein CcmB [Saprospiraceae bacterium]